MLRFPVFTILNKTRFFIADFLSRIKQKQSSVKNFYNISSFNLFGKKKHTECTVQQKCSFKRITRVFEGEINLHFV